MGANIARLKRRAEFLRVAAARRKWATPGLVLQAAETEDARAAAGGFRVGFTASRKVGSAVARNRARRRLRAAVAATLPKRAARGLDYVVIARRGTLTRPFDALTGDLETAIARVSRRGKGRATSGKDAR